MTVELNWTTTVKIIQCVCVALVIKFVPWKALLQSVKARLVASDVRYYLQSNAK